MRRLNLRSAVLGRLAAIGVASLLACSPESPEAPASQSLAPPRAGAVQTQTLETGRPLSGTLKAGERADLVLETTESSWLDVKIELAATMDATLELRSSSGERLLKVDEARDGDPERLVYGPLEDRSYVLRIHAVTDLSYTVDSRLHAEPTARQRTWALAQLQREQAAFDAGAKADIAGLEAAAQTWLELGEPLRAIVVRHELAEALEAAHQREHAIEIYSRNLDLLEELAPKKSKWRAAAFNYRGWLHHRLGRPEHAEADFRDAERIAVESSSLSPLAAALNNLASLHQDRGELDKAQELYEQAIELLGEPSDRLLRSEQAQYLENLSRLQTIQNRPHLAANHLARARQLYEAIGDRRRLERARSEHAWQLLLEDRPRDALEMLAPVVDYFEAEHPWSLSTLVALQRLGQALEDTDRPREAIDVYRRAQHVADAIDSPRTAGLGIIWCRLAVELPNPDLDPLCLEGLGQLRRSDRPNPLVSALYWRARRLADGGRARAALDLLSEAEGKLEQLRTTIEGRYARAQFFEHRSDIYRTKVSVLWQHYAQSNNERDAWRALETSDLLRARAAQDLLGLESTPTASGEPVDQFQRLDSFEDRRLREMHRGGITGEEDAQIARILEEVENRQARALGSSAVRPKLQLEAVRSTLGDDTVVFSLLLHEPESFLFKLSGDRLEIWELPAGPNLERGARRFLDTLERGDVEAIHALGDWLAEQLFGQDRERLAGLEGQRLVFIGEGAFQQLPLSALPAPAAPRGRYLFEDFEVVHAPSLATLLTLRALPRQPPTRSAVLLGDPIYDLDSPMPGSLEPLSRQEKEELFVGSAPANAARLPFADREIELLAPLFEDALIMSRLDATVDAALSDELEHFTLVHAISHGFRDPRFPQLSALRLSEFDRDGRKIDGRLRLLDIYSLRWRAEMVVASACQTGVGGELRLASAGGLARGFLSIGVPRVVVSQWDVDSEATAHLMKAFYEALLVDRASPGEALRRARLHLLRPEGDAPRHWSSPRYWAAFVLIGDWRGFAWPTPPPATSSSRSTGR